MLAVSMPRFRVLAAAVVIILCLVILYHYRSITFTPLAPFSPFGSSSQSNSGEVLIEVDTSGFDRSPLKPLPGEKLSDRWVVVTTIQRPTEDMRLLGQMSKYGWRVLAVGDKSTPSDWKAPPGVRFLPASEAETLGYNLMRYHKWKVYAAKNVGYMFAIHHGAKIIYDTDDDNHPTDMLRSMLDLAGVEFDGEKGSLPRNLTRALYFVPGRLSVPVVNPLPHFGQSLLWPRGYPLREIARSPPRSYRLCSTRPPAWIQGVVNGDPDVDAIYRMTRKHSKTPVNMTFDKATPVMAPQGYYIQSNSQNTLFVQSAIPFIFLPYTVTMRETDIWRAYIGQRMMWLSGNRKGYVSPNAFQDRNPHDYLKDFKDEMKLYLDVEKLVETLQSWKCDNAFDAGACFEDIYQRLASSKYSFVLSQDAYAAAAWVTDLRRIGYPFPKRGEIADCLDETSAPHVVRSSRLAARLYPVEQKTTVPAHSLLADVLVPKRGDHQHSLLHQCAKIQGSSLSPNWQPKQLESVTLLIGLSSLTRSEAVVAAMKRLDLIYQPYIARILFCVPRKFVTDERCVSTAEKYSISLVESLQFDPATSSPSRAEIAADCLQSALEMRVHGEAFIYMAADTYAMVTPSGINKIAATMTKSSATGLEQPLSFQVGACVKKSPFVVAVTSIALPTAALSQTLTNACSVSDLQMTLKACPNKPVEDYSQLGSASVLTGCMAIAEDSSFATQCSIFVANKAQ